MSDGFLCGWRVRSAIDLPELAPWTCDDRAPDISIRLGEVPDHLEDPIEQTPFLQIDAQGVCLLNHDGVAGYLVPDDGTVIVSPAPRAAMADVRLFLLGSVLGFLCHKRGLFPLHASCLNMGGGAVAFSGVSGAGKSTTAIHLSRRGHALLSDDICAIDASGPGGPIVRPSFPRTKLWEDSLTSAEVSAEGLERIRLGRDKFSLRPGGVFHTGDAPLRAIFLLQRADTVSGEGLTRLTNPLEIITALDAEVYRGQAGRALGRRAALFAAEAAIAAAVPVWRLTRPFDFSRMDAWLERVESAVQA